MAQIKSGIAGIQAVIEAVSGGTAASDVDPMGEQIMREQLAAEGLVLSGIPHVVL